MKDTIWKCKWESCLEVYNESKELYVHYLGTHINPQNEDAMKECKWQNCQYSAKTNHQLKSHGFKHIPYKQYECSVCKKSFKWKHDRNKHASAVHRNKLNPSPVSMVSSPSYQSIIPSPMSPAPDMNGMQVYSPMSMMSHSPLSAFYQPQDGFSFGGYQANNYSDTSSMASGLDEHTYSAPNTDQMSIYPSVADNIVHLQDQGSQLMQMHYAEETVSPFEFF